MPEKQSRSNPFAALGARIAVASIIALIAVPGLLFGTTATARTCEVTVVFTESGRTIMTVTPPAGTPVRYEWKTGKTSPVFQNRKFGAETNTRYLEDLYSRGAGSDVRTEPAPAGRAVRGLRTVYILSKTGLRIFKSTLFSVVTSLAQLYSDA